MIDVVVYDGNCGICSFFVNLLEKKDISKRFIFTPNNSQLASQLANQYKINDIAESVFYFKISENKVYKYSDSILEIFKHFQFCRWIIVVAQRIPQSKTLMDNFYHFISLHRSIISKFAGLKRCSVGLK
jgi:predicted DCC family thiol-disulfide oxidoreductase YuxK